LHLTNFHGVFASHAKARAEVLPKLAAARRSYNVFNIGDGANQVPAQSATLSVPLRGDEYLRAMDVIRATAKKFADEHHQFQNGPISMRFVKASNALLGDPEDVCKFEIIFEGNDEHAQKLAKQMTRAYYDALYAALGKDVRVHFGQLTPEDVTGARVRESYPGFDAFDRVRRSLDPGGVMMNSFQERLFGG
jgi:hypothetical protein